jgi:general secretion pathway protein K
MLADRSKLALGCNNAGFVLIAVLTVTALLALMLTSVTLLARGGIDTAILVDDVIDEDALIRSGIELAGHQLFVLGADPALLSGQQLRLNSGTVTIFASSEAGKVDLNGANIVLLIAAYKAAAMTTLTPSQFAARVIDWRDDNDTTMPEGAEAVDYRAAGLGYMPPNAPFRSIADLQYVMGLSLPDVAAISPFITVSNPAGKIDPMFAPVALLAALPNLSSTALNALADARSRNGLDRVFHLRSIFRGLEQHLVLGEALRVFAVHIEARATTTLSLKTADAVLIAPVLSRRAFQITQWRER